MAQQPSGRPPLSEEERQQIKFMGMVLVFVLGAVLLAAVLASVISPLLPDWGTAAEVEDVTPVATVEP